MNTIKFQILLLACAASINFTACRAQETAATAPNFKKYETIKISEPRGAVLTVTRVKAPVYAVRPLVVKGFRDSLPEYRAIPGLSFKAYHLTPDGKFFGGIYWWASEPDAKKWFTDYWFARVEKRYGAPGAVEYFQIVRIQRAAEIVNSDAEFWSVLSSAKNEIKIDANAAGLLKIAELKDAAGGHAALTVWNSKADAEKYFQTSDAANTFFDSPLLLDNEK